MLNLDSQLINIEEGRLLERGSPRPVELDNGIVKDGATSFET
jgi:hypothetical protein